MAFLVQPPIHVPGVGIIRCRQDTEIRVMVGDELAKFPLAIGSVGEDGRSSEINLADQFFGNGDVSGITGGQQNRDGIAQSVHSSVNLGGSAALGGSTATAHSNALIDLGFRSGSVHLWGKGATASLDFESPLFVATLKTLIQVITSKKFQKTKLLETLLIENQWKNFNHGGQAI